MSDPHIILVGAHQRTTALPIRERLAFGPDTLPDALSELRAVTAEVCMLATCNRVEIYAVVAGPEPSLEPIIRFLARQSGIPAHELEPHLRIFSGSEVVRHACRLAAGLDSMVLGEDQIVSQIKEAISTAQEAGTLGQTLTRLLQSALAAGKAVRTQTGIARSHLSVVSVALNEARRTFGGLAGKEILIVGAGQTGELALKHLSHERLVHARIANRTRARAETLARRYGAHAIPLDGIADALRDADIALCATAAPDTIIDTAIVAHALKGRERPLLLLDLAIPRDIDPAVAAMPGVKLLGVDDLQAVCEANRLTRAAEIARAEQLVEEATGKFLEWWAARLATPTIRALRERAEAIRAAEVQRTLARLPQLSEHDQAAIQALSEAIVNKLLHPPIASLKDASAGELINAAQRLFQIDMRPAICRTCTLPCAQCPIQAAA